MAYFVHAEMRRIITQAAEFARRFGQDSIQPADLVLALHATGTLEAGRLLKRYVQEFPLYEVAMKQATSPAAQEEPTFATSSIALFRDAASVAGFYGRGQVTAADLLRTMICDNFVIKMLVDGGLGPREFDSLHAEVLELLKDPFRNADATVLHSSTPTVH